MPRIPIAQIPNAPQLLAPVLRDANMPTLQGVSYDSARGLQQDTIRQGSFDGAAKGMGAIGEALGQVASVGLNLAMESMQRRNDEHVILAEQAWQEGFAGYQASLTPATDPMDYVSGWQKASKQLESQILGNKALSIAAKEAIRIKIGGLNSRATSGLTISQHKATFERSKVAHENLAQELLSIGNIEGSDAVLRSMGPRHLAFPEEIESLIFRNHQVGDVNAATALIQSDPDAALEQLNKPQSFSNLPTAKREQLKDEAGRAIVGKKSSTLEAIRDGIEAGSIIDPDHITKVYGDQVSPDELAIFTKKIAKSQPPNPVKYMDLWSQVEGYKSEEDPTHEKYLKLQTKLLELPDSYTGKLRDQLYKRLSKAPGEVDPNSEVVQAVRGRIKQFYDAGFLGRFDRKEVANNPIYQKMEREAYAKMQRFTDEADEWLEKNPTATRQEATDWTAMRLGEFIEGGEAVKSGSTFKKNPKPTNKAEESPDVKELRDIINGAIPNTKKGAAMDTSSNLDTSFLDAVKKLEGYNPNAFPDGAQTSIGYGTRGKPGEVLTEDQAHERLVSELSTHAKSIDEAIKSGGWNLTPGQRNALISFDFNTGAGVRLLNTSKSVDEIRSRLPSWNKITKGGRKVESEGLVNRRNAEMEMFGG